VIMPNTARPTPSRGPNAPIAGSTLSGDELTVE
jgi:hypothetical protein